MSSERALPNNCTQTQTERHFIKRSNTHALTHDDAPLFALNLRAIDTHGISQTLFGTAAQIPFRAV